MNDSKFNRANSPHLGEISNSPHAGEVWNRTLSGEPLKIEIWTDLTNDRIHSNRQEFEKKFSFRIYLSKKKLKSKSKNIKFAWLFLFNYIDDFYVESKWMTESKIDFKKLALLFQLLLIHQKRSLFWERNKLNLKKKKEKQSEMVGSCGMWQ